MTAVTDISRSDRALILSGSPEGFDAMAVADLARKDGVSVRYAVRDAAPHREAAFSTEGVSWPGLDAFEVEALRAARTMP